MKLSRRSFLHSASVAGSILLLDIRAPLRAEDGSLSEVIAGWIRIDPDGALCLLVNATEMGQGAKSGLAQILAEELEVDWSDVRVDFAPIDREHYGMWETYQTGGSGSIRGMFDRLRTAGATARTMLLQAAAQRWRVPVEECVARSGVVRHAQSSRSASYAALARDALRLPQPKDVPLTFERTSRRGSALPMSCHSPRGLSVTSFGGDNRAASRASETYEALRDDCACRT